MNDSSAERETLVRRLTDKQQKILKRILGRYDIISLFIDRYRSLKEQGKI